ncbi:histidine kinase, partial [Pseudohyphozyma bogoriensis]
LNVAIFHGFVIYTHYRKDLADRRMYTMRSELKIQFKAKQKAQINERKTMDSKRRFSSYIFHEVRVPLNTALLAVQNLEGANVFDKNSDQAVEYAALQGSLEMMSQVLNDVLDFSRMEKGGFTSVSRPFSLHKVMRSIFAPLRLDANRRGLELLTALDVRIDEVAKRAAFPDEVVVGEEAEEGDGMVMGDEMRLRQVINNLATNACKFTRAGGNITITTQLVYPSPPLDKDPTSLSDRRTSDTGSSGETYSPRLSTNRLQAHDAKVSPPASEFLVARIEISDTGVGIKPSDMRENRLFSAYVQTEIGRHQGGKGTGLGLSLVRQIVMLSGGRLGVRSKVGEGSTFWVEMPFLVGPQTRDEWDPHSKPATARTSASDKEGGSSASGDSGASAASGSEGSEMRFIPALLKSRGSEALLGSISEAPPGGQAIEMAPTNFRYTSPPASPSLAQSVATTSPFVSAPSPLAPPRRPEAVTHLSAASASSNISSASAPPTAASPIVTATPVKTQMEFADGPLRVLVVDDDVLTRKLMARMMERLGCVVSTAENGAIALDMILNVPEGAAQEVRDGVDPRSRAVKNYDIVFLDNQMPICSGLQVVAQLRSLARDDLVIGVTANALLSDQEEYLEQGASFVLIKPVLEQDLRRYLIVADQRRSEERNRPAGALPPVVMRPPPLILRVDS